MKKIKSFWTGIVLICLSFSLTGQEEVDISIDHPAKVKAGEVFEVTVTISKGSLTDYSRFSQDLPLGLTATNIQSANADFSFDNQRIRIIWLKLPEANEVKVSYNIMVDERLKGKFILGGVFAYVVDEERKFINFEKSDEITIIPNPSIDPDLVVDIKDFKGGSSGTTMVVAEEKEPFAMAVRQKPVLLSSGGYFIRVLLQNPTGSKYAKVEEVIPPGYIFESVDSHDGIESFSSSTVKFIWMKLPEEPEFEVSYNLVPKRDEPQGDMIIKGQLTYSAGNENKVVEIKEVDIDLESLSVADKRSLLETGEISVSAEKPVSVEQKKSLPVKDPVVYPETALASGQTIANTRILPAGSGVYYRVQIMANQNAFDARALYRQMGVDQEVFVEQHEGFYKYTAGSFTSYEQAVSYRNRLEKIPEIAGAFVVAYRDGKRIPMPSSH
ncbi:MAG: SPOR domain-containing protein [Bacteroidales bacterium]